MCFCHKRFYFNNSLNMFLHFPRQARRFYRQDYKTKRPILIFISLGSNYVRFLDTGIAVNLKNKMLNRDKLIESLKSNEYFLPLGVYYSIVTIDRDILEKLDVGILTLDWIKKDYINLRKVSLDREAKQLNIWSYKEIFN